MKKNSVRLFIAGLVSAIGISAVASVPRHSQMDGVAIQDEVSEIKTQRHNELHADGDISRLSQLQGRYRENITLLKRKPRQTKQIRTRQSARLQPRAVRSNIRPASVRKAPRSNLARGLKRSSSG